MTCSRSRKGCGSAASGCSSSPCRCGSDGRPPRRSRPSPTARPPGRAVDGRRALRELDSRAGWRSSRCRAPHRGRPGRDRRPRGAGARRAGPAVGDGGPPCGSRGPVAASSPDISGPCCARPPSGCAERRAVQGDLDGPTTGGTCHLPHGSDAAFDRLARLAARAARAGAIALIAGDELEIVGVHVPGCLALDGVPASEERLIADTRGRHRHPGRLVPSRESRPASGSMRTSASPSARPAARSSARSASWTRREVERRRRLHPARRRGLGRGGTGPARRRGGGAARGAHRRGGARGRHRLPDPHRPGGAIVAWSPSAERTFGYAAPGRRRPPRPGCCRRPTACRRTPRASPECWRAPTGPQARRGRCRCIATAARCRSS